MQKFIQLSIQLHDRLENDQITTASKFLDHLLTQSKLTGKNLEFVGACNNELKKISEQMNFSLRTLEQIYGHIIRVAATVPENHFRNSAIIIGLCVLKVANPQLFTQAKKGTLEFSQVLNSFGMLNSNDAKYNSAGSGYERRLSDQRWFEIWWRYVSEKNCSEEVIASMSNSMWNFHFRGRLDILPFCANEQIDRFYQT